MENTNESNNNQEIEIEVVNGDGSELEVSPVYEHLNVLKPKSKEEDKKQNIIIPEAIEKKTESNNENK